MMNHKKIAFVLLLCATQGTILPMWEPMAPGAAKSKEQLFNKYSSAYFQNKFATLLSLTAKTDPTTRTRAYLRGLSELDKKYKAELIQLLQGAHQTGLIAQYSSLLLGTNQYLDNDFTRELFFTVPVTMIAHLQNVCGGGQPFVFNCDISSTDQKGVLGKLALIGQYTTQNNQKINVTYYSFLRGIIDSIDTIKKNYTAKNVPHIFFDLLAILERALDDEIRSLSKA